MALSMKSQQPIENRVWQSYSHCSEWNYRASVSFSGQPASLPSWIAAGSKKKKILPWSEIEGPSLASAAFVTAIRMLPFTEVFYPFLKTWQSH
jgi:hypothetical protein